MENFKNLLSTLLPTAKKVISNQINKIKSRIMQKIRLNKIKKRQNTLKRVSNRGIKSLENNFSFKATKNIINTPKIVIEKSPIVVKPNVVTSSKIAAKPKKVSKLKNVNKPKIIVEKAANYNEYKNRVIKQLKKRIKKLYDSKKSSYLDDDDDDEYKGISDLEYLLEEINENDEDYYKPILVKSSFNENYKNMKVEGIRIKNYR